MACGCCEYVEMSPIFSFIDDYQGVINFLSNLLGVGGFVFGLWRYRSERKARADLDDRQKELDDAVARLQHLQRLASGLNQYRAAV
jgi:hypothetical protein